MTCLNVTREDVLTATEMIDGVEHVIVLKEDEDGRYREVLVTPHGKRRRVRERVPFPLFPHLRIAAGV